MYLLIICKQRNYVNLILTYLCLLSSNEFSMGKAILNKKERQTRKFKGDNYVFMHYLPPCLFYLRAINNVFFNNYNEEIGNTKKVKQKEDSKSYRK